MVSTAILAGCRVLDLTRFVAGSYVTMTLAACGADVVKVEVPPHGDSYRGQGTAYIGDESSLFLSLNNGKRSLALDIRHADARPAIDALVAGADVVVSNARPGSLDRYGLGWDAVHARNPGCIYASISGYGDIGPQATRGGFDLVLQAEAGIMSVTGAADGAPVAIGAPLLDVGAAMSCFSAVLLAWIQRLATGEGMQVATSLLEFSLAGLTTVSAATLATGEIPRAAGSHSPLFAPYGAFRAADGWLILAGAGSEHLWRALCDVIGRPGLADDPRFLTNAERVTHRDELIGEIELALAAADVDDWVARLEAAAVPAGRVTSVPDLIAGAQVEALGVVQTLHHPRAGSYRTTGFPFRLGGAPVAHAGPAPLLGQHSREVLAEVGIVDPEIDRLIAGGIVVA